MSDFGEGLPEIYRQLLPSVTKWSLPREEKSTCNNCPMKKETASEVLEQRLLFNNVTKCCTYHPRLPNYLVGGLLSDTSAAFAEGRRRMLQRLETRIGVSPWWLNPPPLKEFLYKQVKSAFGKAESLVCPFFAKESGGCTIWGYRDAVCSTWFCKYQTGADGHKFWMTAKEYLGFVERVLSRYALLQIDEDFVLDDDSAAYYVDDSLNVEALDNKPEPAELYKTLWRDWEGREQEFYVRCFEIVREMNPDQVQSLMGIDGLIKEKDLGRKREASVSADLPDPLRFNEKATAKWLEDGYVALGSYSYYDAVALPEIAFRLLTKFDGKKPLKEVRAQWHKEFETDLSDDIIQTLYRHRVLLPT